MSTWAVTTPIGGFTWDDRLLLDGAAFDVSMISDAVVTDEGLIQTGPVSYRAVDSRDEVACFHVVASFADSFGAPAKITGTAPPPEGDEIAPVLALEQTGNQP